MSSTTSSDQNAQKARRKNQRPAEVVPGLAHDAHDESAAATKSKTGLDSIQIQLQQIALLNQPRERVLSQFVETACRLTNAIWCGDIQKNSQDNLRVAAEFNAVAEQNIGLLTSSVLPTCESSIESSLPRITRNGELVVIAIPVFDLQKHGLDARECLCLALNLGAAGAEPFLIIGELVSSYLSRWYERDWMASLDWQVASTAAVAELMSEIAGAKDSRAAAVVATNRMAEFLGARSVAIGLCRRTDSKKLRIDSISGSVDFDAQGEKADRLVAALQESILRESVTTWPHDNREDRCMKLAHEQLSNNQDGATVVSAPLTTHNGSTIGAWICIFEKDQQHLQRIVRFSEIISPFLADALECSVRAGASPFRRLAAQSRAFAKGKVAKIIAAGILLFVLMMAIPIPHRIDCPCVLQPSTKRFAVAPHDGILEESFVQPGDIVSAGQVIARMDDRELQLELSDVMAERERAIKKRDVNRTLADAAGTRIAELEVEQLNVKIKLLQYRLQNLEIKSAVDGIVLQGDLEDAKGAPVRTGDVLMEIAPLDELKLEIDVRERDVGYIRHGQKTAIVLDGNPLDRMVGQVKRIRPVSEVRDNQNIFVTEVAIENENQILRPGMRGRAKISEGFRSLGWVLFHHAWEKAYSVWR